MRTKRVAPFCFLEPDLDPWIRLAAAILLRAIRDVVRDNAYSASARRFLLSEDAEPMMQVLRLDRQAVRDVFVKSRLDLVTMACRAYVTVV
jgi:hypothetical protein